ncbi:tape measure protein, partial [Bilophila wadsworthia]
MARKTPGIYIAIRGDYSAFETDLNHAKKMAQAQGDAIAKSIGNAVSKADLSGGINKLTRELKTAQAALSAGAFKGQVSGLEEIAKVAGVSSKQLEGLTNSMLKSQAAATANRAFEYLQKNAGLSTLELAKLRVQLGDTSGAMSTLWSGAKAAAVPVMAIGAAAIYAGKACFDASLQMDRLVKSYTTIEGSTSGAVSQLDYIYEISNKLGLEFQSTAEAAKGFFAAGKGSALQKDLNGIFEGLSQAGAALSLSTEQMDGVFLALGQMISKGKVQAEELRGQLGERLPGAFNLAARAMGVTTAQLDDMLKKGQVTAEDMLPKLAAVLKDEFGPAAEQASQGAQGAVNRLSTEWNLFKATVMDNKGIIAAINAITGALENRNQAMMKAARREAAIKSLEEDGVIKQGEKQVTDVSIASGAVTVQKIKFYTEEQIKARMGLEKAWEAHNKHSKQLQEEETKIIADGSAATKNFLKNSTEGKKSALQEDYNNTLKALNAQITVYKKQGQDVSGLEQERLKITAEYQRQLESINKKGTKSAETAAKRAAVSGINLDELRKSVEALEAANIPAAKSFDQMAEKIREQSKQTQIAIEADAARMVATKKLTVAQAEEWKGLKFREDAAKTTQKLAEVEAKRGEQDKKYADLRLDFEKRYADMVGLSSEAVSKSISKQAEEYRKAIEAGENAAEELVRLEEWKRDQIQRASREAMDGAQVALRDYQVEASNQAKSMNDAFRGLFSGMDSGWKSAWEQMIETGKVSLSSFRSVFASFLADLMHMAITRPITVQIAGVVSGMLGTGGVAQAAGGSGGMGGIGNLSGLSNLMPGSWFSGIGDTINNTMAGWFPSLFSSSSGYMEAAGTELLKAGITGTAPSAAPAPGTFLSTVSPYLMAGGLGSLGYSVLGGALGLPQSKYSGLTAGLGAAGGFGLGSLAAGSSIMAGTSLATGAALGSVVPVVGTVLGAIGGGLLGSLFGGGRRTHASVYGKMEDVGFSRDQQTYIDAFMGGAWYDRAGKSEAEPFAQGIAQVASQTAGSLLDIAGALPEQIRQNALSGLETSTWSAGRGVSDASWNFQWWEEGMA